MAKLFDNCVACTYCQHRSVWFVFFTMTAFRVWHNVFRQIQRQNNVGNVDEANMNCYEFSISKHNYTANDPIKCTVPLFITMHCFPLFPEIVFVTLYAKIVSQTCILAGYLHKLMAWMISAGSAIYSIKILGSF